MGRGVRRSLRCQSLQMLLVRAVCRSNVSLQCLQDDLDDDESDSVNTIGMGTGVGGAGMLCGGGGRQGGTPNPLDF